MLLALYLCTLITRNTLEPRLLSAQAGLPPVASLFAMYLGYCTFGIAGMVLFPFFLLLLSQIRNTRPEKGIKKRTTDRRSLFSVNAPYYRC